LQIDGTTQGTSDCYSAGQVDNVIKNITGISITSTGAHTVKIVMATKNAASSKYGLNSVGWMRMFRTA
jgi:hypothetical protein